MLLIRQILAVGTSGQFRHGTKSITTSGKWNFIKQQSCLKFVSINQNIYCTRHGAGGYFIPSREFQTTPCRAVVPPVVLMLLSKIGQAGAIILGRRFRNLPKERKAEFMAKAKKNRRFLYGLLAALGIGGLVYYQSHLEECPITKRKRFIVFNDDQLQAMSDVEMKMLVELHQNKLIPSTDPRYKRVYNVAQRLIDANKDLLQKYGKNKEWTLSLIDDKTVNAFVLSNGNIFVFTGLMDICDEDGDSESTLAAFLAHELSHVIMSHASEQASVLHLLDAIFIIPFLILWSIVPSDVAAVGLQWLLGRISDIVLTLPYGRTLETEADEVGLIMAAKACFDIRESCLIWKKLELRNQQEGVPQIHFLSTHPSGERRYENLSDKLPEALTIRENCKCPKLPFLDAEKRIRDYEKKLRKPKIDNTILIAKPLAV